MKILVLGLALAVAAANAGPSVSQFNAALAAACPEHRAAARNVSCERAGAASIQFTCRYELQGADGNWASHEAILQLAEGEWVWIDGPTRCNDEAETSLN